jgi:hypothetical protein
MITAQKIPIRNSLETPGGLSKFIFIDRFVRIRMRDDWLKPTLDTLRVKPIDARFTDGLANSTYTY